MQRIKRRLWVTVGLAILLVFIILLPLFAVAAILTDESDNQNGSLSDMESGQIRLEYVSGKMKISQNSIRLDVLTKRENAFTVFTVRCPAKMSRFIVRRKTQKFKGPTRPESSSFTGRSAKTRMRPNFI